MSAINTKNDPEKQSSKRQTRWAAVALFVAFSLGIALGSARSNTVLAVGKTYDNLEVFAEVLSTIERNYVEKVDKTKLMNGAINGMLRTLDPHSSYMTPEMYKEMQAETEGQFGGVGIEISIKDDLLTVVAPIEETPAWRAGIKAGDRIVKVDGKSTFDMSLMGAVRKMRGKKGEPVVLTIVRTGFKKPRDFTIVRDIIRVTSIKYQMLPDKWAYARIRSFSKDTGADLKKALNKMKQEGSRGLVLDLRNDPGGLLNQAVAVAEQFLQPGELIVYTRGRMPNQNMEFTARNTPPDNQYPMVILVNHGSASASEIVAGSMQDLKRAILVGTQTFGKGSVQTIMPLKGNGGLRLTTAKYYTPAGRQIQGVGIAPDIVVKPRPAVVKAGLNHEAVPDKKGPSVKEKLEAEIDGKKIEKKNGKRPIVNLEKDYQLQRAIGVLKSWEIIKGLESRRLTVAKRS